MNAGHDRVGGQERPPVETNDRRIVADTDRRQLRLRQQGSHPLEGGELAAQRGAPLASILASVRSIGQEQNQRCKA
jgi:hypothetical protein